MSRNSTSCHYHHYRYPCYDDDCYFVYFHYLYCCRRCCCGCDFGRWWWRWQCRVRVLVLVVAVPVVHSLQNVRCKAGQSGPESFPHCAERSEAPTMSLSIPEMNRLCLEPGLTTQGIENRFLWLVLSGTLTPGFRRRFSGFGAFRVTGKRRDSIIRSLKTGWGNVQGCRTRVSCHCLPLQDVRHLHAVGSSIQSAKKRTP